VNFARHRGRGSTLIEFTLVGIPVIFILISIFEISRGMWLYHTLAYSIKEGVRFAIVRGHDCVIPPNNCAATVGDIADRIRMQSIGFVPSEIRNLTFRSPTRTITCATLEDCLANTTYFPSGGPGQPKDTGGQRLGSFVEISAVYPFRSAIAMFWPGAGRGMNFGEFMLPASSKEMIQY
jgi:TadE-like protein